MEELFAKIGIPLKYSDGKFRPLCVILEDLSKQWALLTQEEQDRFIKELKQMEED